MEIFDYRSSFIPGPPMSLQLFPGGRWHGSAPGCCFWSSWSIY